MFRDIFFIIVHKNYTFLYIILTFFYLPLHCIADEAIIDNGQWINSDFLKPGMKILTADNRIYTIMQSWQPTKESKTTYNLSIENHHTYFVSSAKLWAHNITDCYEHHGVLVNRKALAEDVTMAESTEFEKLISKADSAHAEVERKVVERDDTIRYIVKIRLKNGAYKRFNWQAYLKSMENLARDKNVIIQVFRHDLDKLAIDPTSAYTTIYNGLKMQVPRNFFR